MTWDEIVSSPWFYLANVIFDAACYYWLAREFRKGGADRVLASAGIAINTLCLYRDWLAFEAAREGKPVTV